MVNTVIIGDPVRGYMAIEAELQKRQKHVHPKKEDIKFRVEFRYKKGTKHWSYFSSYKEAATAEDTKLRYSIWGDAIIERPTSRQIQVQGKRGGWAKYKATTDKWRE